MIQTYIREELPIKTGAELKLINTQVLDDGNYEIYESTPGYNENAYYQQQTYLSQQPQTFATSQIYSPPPPPPPQIYTSQNQVIQGSTYQQQIPTYQQQPLPQQYIYQSAYEQEQPVIQPKAIPQPLYSQSLINQQQVHVQRPLYNEQMQVMSQPGLYNPQVTSLYGSQYLNQQPAVLQQPTFQPPVFQQQGEIIRQQGEIIRQPVFREQIEGFQQYQMPPNQYQYQEMQPSVVRQNIIGQQGVVDFRTEQLKQGGYERGPRVLQSVQEERVERYEDNDLDKRVRDALRATQETIDRNTKMQNEAQKYQYGKKTKII